MRSNQEASGHTSVETKLFGVPSDTVKMTRAALVIIMICWHCGMCSSGTVPEATSAASSAFHCLCSKAVSPAMVRPSQDADR